MATEQAAGQIYKAEIIADLQAQGEAEVSYYTIGQFTDLCRGPHVASTADLRSAGFLVHRLAGAYWRGSENNPMLQRIYATSFPKKAMLDDYLNKLEEAKKRDHRRLGKELGLFVVMDEGPGFPFFLPKGMALRN